VELFEKFNAIPVGWEKTNVPINPTNTKAATAPKISFCLFFMIYPLLLLIIANHLHTL
jgi:hypothetical protein